jgi:hypothetical protein
VLLLFFRVMLAFRDEFSGLGFGLVAELGFSLPKANILSRVC